MILLRFNQVCGSMHTLVYLILMLSKPLVFLVFLVWSLVLEMLVVQCCLMGAYLLHELSLDLISVSEFQRRYLTWQFFISLVHFILSLSLSMLTFVFLRKLLTLSLNILLLIFIVLLSMLQVSFDNLLLPLKLILSFYAFLLLSYFDQLLGLVSVLSFLQCLVFD